MDQMVSTGMSSRVRRMAYACLAIACLATTPAPAIGQDDSAGTAKDVILARKTLMNSIMDKMDWITEMISQGTIDLDKVHALADDIAVMLTAFPHLFPPNSNQWKENADIDPATDTVASPDIWIDFADFYRRSAAAAKTADDLRRADSEDEVKRLNRALGVACDTCHSLYLKE